jgi:hypothetical protein
VNKRQPGEGRSRGHRDARRLTAPRPFAPGRAEPPVPIVDDLEELVAPPLAGKVHPPDDMDEATPALDDELRRYRHHPNDAGSVELHADPDAADAAADLASDLGSAFLSGATRGEDMSDLAMMADERAEDELPLVLDENAEEPVEDELPRSRRGRRR